MPKGSSPVITPKAPAPVIPTTALVASAVAYPGDVQRIYRGQAEWQKEAWRQYDITPELGFAAGWVGNALSRCTLLPGEVNEDGNDVILSTDPKVKLALQALFTGADGQAQMLSSLGLHLTVAGENVEFQHRFVRQTVAERRRFDSEPVTAPPRVIVFNWGTTAGMTPCGRVASTSAS